MCLLARYSYSTGAILIGGGLIHHSFGVVARPLAAAVLFGGLFYLIAWVSKGRAMGGGDIKLAFVMGLLLGFQKTTLAMLIAFNAAAVVGIVLIAMRRKKRKDTIAFGPFLIGGTLIAYLYGDSIISWYLKANSLVLLG